MLNLMPHNRIHIPNRLAIFAAVLLLISSFAGFDNDRSVHSVDAEATPSVKVDNSGSDTTEHKRRGLNLGLLLFRRG